MGPELASQSVDMVPPLLLEPMLLMDMLPVDTMLLTLLELCMLLRERLRLNQRLRLMLFMVTMYMVLDTLPTPDQSMEDTPHTPDLLSPAMLPHLSLLLLTPDPSMEDTPATMAREMLRLNQRLMLMLFMATMDMVLATLPTPDLSMEDTPPTPDQLSPAMLPDQLSPPLDTLPTLDQSMEDTPATMARERLKLNQRLMLMLFMATTDMVLDTLPTPDPLSPAMLPGQLFPPLATLPTPDQSMEDTPATMAREKLKQRLMPNTLDTLDSMVDTPPMPDPLFPLSTPDQSSPLYTLEESMDTTKPASNQKDNQRH